MTIDSRRLMMGLCLLVPLVSAPIAHATVIVSLEIPSSPPVVGESFDVQIVADIPDAVLGWGLDFGVAMPGVATVTGVQITDPWLSATAADGDELAGVAFPNSVTGSHVLLATVTLEALAEGSTDLFVSDDYPADLTEGFALDPNGFASVEYRPAVVSIVPEPASIGTLGTLAVLAYLRRRAHR